MVSLRDVRVANTSGHCIWVMANKPTLVPGPLVDTAASLGCVPADAKVYQEHKDAQERYFEEEQERYAKLVDACERLVKRNDIKDFTPSGYPKCDVLAKEAGVDARYVSDTVRSRVFETWRTRNQKERDAGEPAKKGK